MSLDGLAVDSHTFKCTLRRRSRLCGEIFSVPLCTRWQNKSVPTVVNQFRDHPDAPAAPFHATLSNTCRLTTPYRPRPIPILFGKKSSASSVDSGKIPKKTRATLRKFALLTDAPKMDKLQYGRVVT